MRLRFGTKVSVIQYALGELIIAQVREDISHGIEYNPTRGRKVSYYWLCISGERTPIQCKSVADAIKRLKEMCGGDFYILTKTETMVNTLEWKEIEC